MPIYARRHNGTLTVRNNLSEAITIVRAGELGIIAPRLDAGAVISKAGAESVTHVSYLDASGARRSVEVGEAH